MMADREWVFERIRQYGERNALIADGRTFTFKDIDHAIDQWSDKLARSNAVGNVVIVNGDYSEETVGALLALYQHSCIAVPLHGADVPRVEEVAALTGADYVIEATSLRNLARVAERKQCHPLVARLNQSNEAGLVLLSSGSTGTPKAMVLSLDRLFERHRHSTRSCAFVTAAFLLFDHIGGFNTLTYCLLNGGVLVKLSSRDPLHVCQSVAQYKIELLPSTPTFLNMLLISRACTLVDMSSLKLITYGTEVMPQSTLSALVEAFPRVTFKQTYGMSEVGILATKSKANDSLWMKVGKNTSTKVVDGLLWIKSQEAMLGYLNAESPFDEDGWLCTGDLVEMDGEYIKVCGRKEQVVNVGGLKVFPAEVENHVLRVPCVNDVVVWGKKNPVTGYIVAASIVKSDDVDPNEAKRQIVEYCRQHLEEFKIPRYIEFVDRNLYTERFKKAKVGHVE